MEKNDVFKEGVCDGCSEYSYELTSCPESFEEVDSHCSVESKFCKECCKVLFNDKDCTGSCGQKFLEELKD